MNLPFNTRIEFKNNAFPLFDCQIVGIEVEAIHENATDCCRVFFDENGTPGKEIHFWSVYARGEDGLARCLADCDTEKTARQVQALLTELMVKYQVEEEDTDHLGSFSIGD